jgi:hypothetical protein
MEQTIADTIVWMAEERVKGEGGDGDLVRAIYSVWMEVGLLVGEKMRILKDEHRTSLPIFG